MSTPRRNWTESEIEAAIDLYVRTPFGRIHARNPDIVRLAAALDRTPSSVALKLTNLASIDDTLDRRGMSHASSLDRRVWSRFFEQLREFSKSYGSGLSPESANELGEFPQASYLAPAEGGLMVQRLIDVRVGQDYFRRMVLASYEHRCAITGIAQPELLVAGHIRPWAIDTENRINPHNGLCLNRLHDKAFEEQLIAIDPDGRVLYSKRLKAETRTKMKMLNDGGRFEFPAKFKPNSDFLEEHREKFLRQEATS